jgi:hypothetical protein
LPIEPAFNLDCNIQTIDLPNDTQVDLGD